jgi:hypothetical protein
VESDQPAGVVSLLVGYSCSYGFLRTYGAEIPMMLTGQEPPSQADDGSGFFTLATFNVLSGRNGGLESALRAMAAAGVDCGVFMKTKITDDIYTQFSSGYNVFASNSLSVRQGGIALFWRDNDLYEIEESKIHGPNVLSFKLVTGKTRFYIVGAYLPPSDPGTTLMHVKQAWKECPNGCKPILLGDPNANILFPCDKRQDAITEMCDSMALSSMSDQFRQRHWHGSRGARWTWHMRRGGRFVSSTCDYLLARGPCRKRFQRVRLVNPRHHYSDHCAIVARLYSGLAGEMKTYRKARQRCPLRLPRVGPMRELESLFNNLQLGCKPLPLRERPANKWISDATWLLINQRAHLYKSGKLTQRQARCLGRRIKAALGGDWQQCAANVVSKVEGYLSIEQPKEAWRCLKGWYRSATNQPPKLCHLTMTHLTKERTALYARVPTPGGRFPIVVDPFFVQDKLPTDSKIRDGVQRLWNGSAAGTGGMRTEHLKEWLSGMVEEEERGTEGAGDKWWLFEELAQSSWEHGCIPEQMTWTVIVLLPKSGGGHRGISQLEPCWKVMESVLVQQLSAIQCHDSLLGGINKKGTGTATIEVKLAQQLALLDQEPWHQIFLDLHKAYDAIYWEKTLEILADCGIGPKALRIIQCFWNHAKLVCLTGGCYGDRFTAYRGVTQGGPLSPLIFNVVVNAVVREWLRRTLDNKAARDGLTIAQSATRMVSFYVDDGVYLQGTPCGCKAHSTS